MLPVQEVESLDSMKFLTKAELVEQIVRPLEEVGCQKACFSSNHIYNKNYVEFLGHDIWSPLSLIRAVQCGIHY